MLRQFTSDLDVSATEQSEVLDLALDLKANRSSYSEALAGQTLAMIFQKSSTRTRVSFEAGMGQLGGRAIFLSARDMQLGRGEPISDTGAVLSRYVDIIMIRTFAHSDVQGLAKSSTVPVINGLDDSYHPCQVLADLLTIREHCGATKGKQLVYVGDGNNMLHSLMLGGALAGLNVRAVTPKGYEPDGKVVERAQGIAKDQGASIETSTSMDAIEGADVVYSDTWTSMGQEEERAERLAAFAGYEVDDAVMERAGAKSAFMHCLPAHRGEEVSESVIDGPRSIIYDQAENRLHAQKALMVWLDRQRKS